MNPFLQYRHINAEKIIQANIRPNHINTDARGLINALQSVTFIAQPDSQKAATLHRSFIQKLVDKSYTLDLLSCFGYSLNEQGDYVYQKANSDNETVKRINAANEFQNFFNDLKKIREGTLNGFEEYINRVSSRPQSRTDHNDEKPSRSSIHERLHPSSSTPTPTATPLMPHFGEIKEKNEKTMEKVRNFKEILVSNYSGRPAHSFIRRKLLYLLFNQKYPEAIQFGDDEIDRGIDRRVRELKHSDTNQNAPANDEIYYECLLRANLEHERALEILQKNRPNLQPPPEPETPRGPTTTTINSSLKTLQQQWRLLNENADENGAGQDLVHAGDEWKNTVHLVTAIVQLRQKFKEQAVDQIHRLLFSELARIVDFKSSLKIEILSYVLCEVDAGSLEYITMSDIRDILRSCKDTEIPENYRDNVFKYLSMDCPICGSTFPRSHMEKMFLCDHICCLDCTKMYYRMVVKEIRDPDSLKRLTCSERHDIPDDVKMVFFSYLETKLNQWFTNERLVLDAYHENLFIATRDSQVKKCCNPKCVGFFDNNNNNRVARAQCPHCQFEQCQLCCRKWFNEHSKITCDQYAEWLKDNDPDDPEVQLTKYLNTAGMVCPNKECNAVYEYQPGGCEHFTCPTCKTEFCRICSALFCNPKHNIACPRAACPLKNTVHAHCYYNCYREIRDAEHEEIITVLTAHKINALEELRQKPTATGIVCPVDGCRNAPSARSENRFCDVCYKQFLCLLVWRNQIEPWELYTDNNLRQKLINATVAVPANAARPALIALAKQHLITFLGKPIPMPRIR